MRKKPPGASTSPEVDVPRLMRFDPAEWEHEPDPVLRRVRFIRARQEWEAAHNRCGPWHLHEPHRSSDYFPNNFVERCTCNDGGR